jgi:uncharacterized protein (TIGR02145 family)
MTIMKGRLISFICTFTIVGVLLLLTSSCKKDGEKDNNLTSNEIKDIDGNIYHAVTIGTQIWMVENLKTTRYRNGDTIGSTIPDTLEIANEIQPKYQWAYKGHESNAELYGRLYTWYAVVESRIIAPIGWHVPTDAEWTTLTDFLGSNSIAGGKLKETGINHWNSENTGATNESGFTALPGGYRNFSGAFGHIGSLGNWWSSSDYDKNSALYLSLSSYENSVYRHISFKKYGFSVRCIKD